MHSKKPSSPQDPDGGDGAPEHGGRQGGGEDEARAVGAHQVDQSGAAGDVPADVAKGLAWQGKQNRVS